MSARARLLGWWVPAFFLLPWAQAALPVSSYQGWMTIFLAAGLWSSLLLAITASEKARLPAPLLLACLLALPPGWIAYRETKDASDLLVTICDAWIALALLIAGARIAADRELRAKWLKGGAFILASIGAISLLAWLTGKPQPWTLFGILIAHGAEASKPAGPWTNGNVMGGIAAAGFLIAWHLWRAHRLRWALVFAAMALICGWASMSRSLWGWLLLLSLWLGWDVRDDPQRNKAWLLLAVCPWIGWMIGAWGAHLASALGPVWRVWVHTEQSGLGVRATLWLTGLELAWQAFPWGLGWGRLAAHYFDAQDAFLLAHPDALPLQQPPRNMHDWPLHLLVEGGVFGAGIMAIAFWALLRLAPMLRSVRDDRWPFAACAWLLALHGLTNLTLSRPFPLLFFLLCLGGGLATQEKAKTTHRWAMPAATLLVSLLLLPIAASHIAHWKRFDLWLQLKAGRQKATLAKELLDYPSTQPLALSIILYQMGASDQALQRFPQLEPLMRQARKVQDFAVLDQGLFIAAFKASRMHEACRRGQWLRRGGWELTKAFDQMVDQACASARRAEASQRLGTGKPARARSNPASATMDALSVQ